MSSPAFVPLPPLFHSRNSSPFLCNSFNRTSRNVPISTRRRQTPTAAAPADTVSSTFSTSTDAATYDYVIVGAGAAGCVLANRLSADPKFRVLLLEAGPQNNSFYHRAPLGFPYLLGSQSDWAFVTEPEPNLNNRRLYFPRGKLLGGSHAISVMLYHRGHPADYHIWNKGSIGWGPDDVLPYFVKSETQQANDKRNSPAHGIHGPLSVSDLERLNPMCSAFLEASVDAGLGKNPDFNNWGTSQDGVGAFQVTQRKGNRETPATAYLSSISSRPNLTIETAATVERILFKSSEDAAPVATGVSFIDSKGKRCIVNAAREVLLSGGVYASPQLLMLSGVGPAEHLRSLGIPVVADIPAVGQNLQDHPAAMLSYESHDPQGDKKKSDVYYTEQTGKSLFTLFNYIFRGKGPLTSPMCEAGGFVKTQKSMDSCDLQLRFIPFVSEPDPYLSLSDFATRGSYMNNRANRPAGFTLQSVVARPHSRGYVNLRSTDVRDSMSIHPNWMSDPQDMKTLVDGIKLSRKIASSGRMSEYRGREVHPGADSCSDDDIEAYIRDSCHTANAMVGTCRMGADDDAVVDGQLRVRGISGLRVIDSSIMPTLPGGQSGAPTMMIGEKGADMVRQAAMT